jgi:predicted ArsR family transcriptional regulator
VDDQGTIRLRNCPFAALTDRFRDTVCAINLSLHHGVLDGLAAEGLEARLDPGPNRCCVAILATG